MLRNCKCLGGGQKGSDIKVDDGTTSSKRKNGDSFSKKRFCHEHPEGLIEPGNQGYLSYYPYQDGWTPSKPIGALGSGLGPGPATVNLPSTIGDKNPDLRKVKAPAFKIGERETPAYNYVGPGPAAYDTTKITNKGIDECHAPKVGEKCTDLEAYMSPGPAAYTRGDSDATAYPHAPVYTMRPKVSIAKKFTGPSPNAYTLPDCLRPGRTAFGGGPAYSVGIKDKIEHPLLGPGPAGYEVTSTNVCKEKPPEFSIGQRTQSRRTGTETPGPASNSMHLVKFHKSSTPRFSFGIRHSPYKAFQKFAPGD